MNKLDNKGSIALEATLILPLFIFAMLAVYHIGQIAMAEATLYEAGAETAEYMAEYAYVGEGNYLVPSFVFSDYIDNEDLVERYVDGGTSGVNFLGSGFLTEENDIVLKINYSIVLELPFLPRLCKNKTVTIRQRAYVGFKSDDTDEDIEDDATTVYVAENESVYHVDSNCSHLNISVFTREKNQAQTDGYSSCEICGSRCGDLVYVTEDGEKYHSTKSCSGLKRTIYQISIEDVGNLSCCSRCGN